MSNAETTEARYPENTPEAAAYWREVAKGRLSVVAVMSLMLAAAFFGLAIGRFMPD
jgi:hypothetical protein